MNKELIWLYTHCRAIGMTCKSDSGNFEEDIALFTVNLKAEVERLKAELAAAQNVAEAWNKELAALKAQEPVMHIPSGFTFDKVIASAYPEDLVHLTPINEPVAWMSPGKERLEFSDRGTVYGSHTIPLYTHPPEDAKDAARLRAALITACERMKLARDILTDGNPQPESGGMK